ncbi:MAG: cell division protein FtsZ, partial [Chloroflexota bacterium]
EGIERLGKHVDTMIVIPNDRLLEVVDPKASVSQAFLEADDLLRQGIQGISDLITGTGLVNVDFNDVRSIMGDGGAALMAIGSGQGENRARDAVMNAVNSPLLDVSIDGAKGVLFNIKGGEDMSLFEVNEAAEVVRQMVDDDANIIFGAAVDGGLDAELEITVIATGFDASRRKKSSESSREQAAGKTIEFPVRNFDDEDDLDVPAFLRRNPS